MTPFNPQKLSVKLIPPATSAQPVEHRTYTLTHSDTTGDLFLSIGYTYDDSSINWKMRDEVIAEWRIDVHGRFVLLGKAYVDGGEFTSEVAQRRFGIFQKEMGLALQAIVYGDLPFYAHYPTLLDAPIMLKFTSTYPAFNQIGYYGTPRQYANPIQYATP
ncbi:staygreen family protein [Brevibacillus invocatus]|uniref:Staygreen protein domain-containing protein n=1 Tax=Brevibacillus invocatus TaxID=173959 RepID=A0A3M8C957_9BACL|nr:staygreen family protein [Brevibacillus invocatus]MCM3081943.1 staygreen family protein [Brevibacillus invocatus]MCM3432339.1 staygreen family protein [Brevibacillus invocatus]RNB71495.1 hypothetical protein EDM52_14730 [Brevibacillus invocatus]